MATRYRAARSTDLRVLKLPSHQITLNTTCEPTSILPSHTLGSVDTAGCDMQRTYMVPLSL